MARHHQKHISSSKKDKCGCNKSETSSTDLSYLCDDHHKHSSSSSSDECDSTSSSYESESSSCQGCQDKCTTCVSCISCGCRDCGDYSRTSVLRSLGSSSDPCSELSGLAKDRKKKCRGDKKKHHTSTSDSTHTGGHGGTRGRTFNVTFGDKQGSQAEKYNTIDQSIWINGKNTPILHLYRGTTYYFCVTNNTNATTQFSFVLTDSPSGGLGSDLIAGARPVSDGCIAFRVTSATPRYFFYQTDTHSYMGGLVIVHDAK